MIRIFKGVAVFLSTVFFTNSVLAGNVADWPEKEITIVVPYSAGGTTDITARKIASEMEKRLDVRVIIKNQPGAGSTLATQRFSLLKDDNYTLIMASPGHVIGKALYPGLTYDPLDDFTFIHSLLHISNIMTVPLDSPYDSVEAFVKGAKEKGNFTFSSSGVGSSIHLSAELFKKLSGIQMTHVPFKGSAKAMPAILNGDVDVVFENASAIVPHIKNEKVKPLATTSLDGVVDFPELPSVAVAGKEVGLADFSVESWFGLLAKKGMDEAVAEKLRKVVSEASQAESFKAFAKARSGQVGLLVGKDFEQFIDNENKKWSVVVKELNLSK